MDVGACERGQRRFLGELHLARDVEQELGARRELELACVAAQLANRLRNARGVHVVLAQVLDLEAACPEQLGEPRRQCRLAAAVDPLESDQHQKPPPISAEKAVRMATNLRAGLRKSCLTTSRFSNADATLPSQNGSSDRDVI
jgi:hypothetical protein